MNHDRRVEALTLEFTKLYGEAPTDWFRAPGRVDLMGSHTDYNDGYVATMTVDRDTWIAIRPRIDRRARSPRRTSAGPPTSAWTGSSTTQRRPGPTTSVARRRCSPMRR